MLGQLNIPGLGGAKPADAAPAAAPAPAVTTSAPAAAQKTKFGLSNVKRFGFAGPLGFELGVARDAAKSGPDLTAGLAFTGMDWKLTRLVPTL